MARPGAVRLEPRENDRKKKPWWLLLVLAVVIIALLLLLLSRCGSDAKTKGQPASTTQSQTSSTAAPTPAGSPTQDGTPTPSDGASPTASGTDQPATGETAGAPGGLSSAQAGILPASSSAQASQALRQHLGEKVTGTAVTVLSVPADEGFWVGTQKSRVWVQLRGNRESKVMVRPGAKLDITGVVTAHGPGFARRVGVGRTEGASDLTAARAHVDVQRTDLEILGS